MAKPNVGEKSPASVRAEITLNIGKRGDIRSEWEALRKHDVCFLVTCRYANGETAPTRSEISSGQTTITGERWKRERDRYEDRDRERVGERY